MEVREFVTQQDALIAETAAQAEAARARRNLMTVTRRVLRDPKAVATYKAAAAAEESKLWVERRLLGIA